MPLRILLAVAGLLLVLLANAASAAAPQHWLYFPSRGGEGETLRATKALSDPRFVGAQIAYPWRLLEPKAGEYDFSAIRADLVYLRSQHKQLWVQLQDKSFTPQPNVPAYLLSPAYQGGALKQSMASAPERDPTQPLGSDEYGWVPKMWEPSVRGRYQALIKALGQEFDGQIAGINFSESAIDIGTEHRDGTTTWPAGFAPAQYVAAIEENMGVLAAAFPHSTAMVYLNFLPGEWLPWDDHGYMRRLFQRAAELKMGVGGPDLMPYRKAHMQQSYAFLRAYPAELIKALAVQDGNLRQKNPKTGKRNTVADNLQFAEQYLGLDYIFWGLEEPYFSREVLPKLPAAK
ncbi:hypothetical protein [Chitinibacter tainanensis]|uniref:hypothetical protein n=1 Tax=Chitinibacter tainanensis TaxID=230667 RepID=UPI0003FA7A9C|nr:hypothetical protein [Chitinibacter tainanensis]